MESVGFLKYSLGMLTKLNLSRTSRLIATANCRKYSNGGNQSADTEDGRELPESEKKLHAEIETLTKEVQTLKEKNNDIFDKYRRALADGENLRVRLTKQIQDAKVFGIQSFCKDLLEVADTLGHATNAVPKDQLAKNEHLKNLYDGLTLTNNSLTQVFKRHGLEQINPLKEKFDPNLHEALFQKECNNVEPGTVVEVTKVGYKLNDRCIRPALVGVSRN